MIHVLVIAPHHRKRDTVNLLENFRRQRYPRKTLLVIENGELLDDSVCYPHPGDIDIRTVACGHTHQSTARNVGLRVARQEFPGSYVVNMDSDDFYGPGYLDDHVDHARPGIVRAKRFGWVFTDDLGLVFLRGSQVDSHIESGACGGTIGGFLPDLGEYPIVPASEEYGFLESCRAKGAEVRALSPLHYLYVRSGSKNDHTYRGSTVKLLRASGGFIRVDADPAEAIEGSSPYGPVSRDFYVVGKSSS